MIICGKCFLWKNKISLLAPIIRSKLDLKKLKGIFLDTSKSSSKWYSARRVLPIPIIYCGTWFCTNSVWVWKVARTLPWSQMNCFVVAPSPHLSENCSRIHLVCEQSFPGRAVYALVWKFAPSSCWSEKSCRLHPGLKNLAVSAMVSKVAPCPPRSRRLRGTVS